MGQSKIAGGGGFRPTNSRKEYRQACWYEDADIAFLEEIINDVCVIDAEGNGGAESYRYIFKMYDDRYLLASVNGSHTSGYIVLCLMQIDITNRTARILTRSNVPVQLSLSSFSAGYNFNQLNEHILYFTGRYAGKYSSLTPFLDTAIYVIDDVITAQNFDINVKKEITDSEMTSGDIVQVDDVTALLPYAYYTKTNGISTYHTIYCGVVKYTISDNKLSYPQIQETYLAQGSTGYDNYMTTYSAELVRTDDKWQIVGGYAVNDFSTKYSLAAVSIYPSLGTAYKVIDFSNAVLVNKFKPLYVNGTKIVIMVGQNNYQILDYSAGTLVAKGGVVATNENIDPLQIVSSGGDRYYYGNFFAPNGGQQVMTLSGDGIVFGREGMSMGESDIMHYDQARMILIGVSRDSGRLVVKLAKYPYVKTVRNHQQGNIIGVAALSGKSGSLLPVYVPR